MKRDKPTNYSLSVNDGNRKNIVFRLTLKSKLFEVAIMSAKTRKAGRRFNEEDTFKIVESKEHLSISYRGGNDVFKIKLRQGFRLIEPSKMIMNLSIIIIAYNEEKHLPPLLNSLSKQTFKEFEVIVVDSNSTDDTGQLAKIYESRLENLRYLRLNCTEGPGYARNKGAEQAKYERLIFLDADTMLQEDFIEKVTVELDQHKPDVATCQIRIAAGDFISSLGAMFLNLFMILLKPVYSSAYGACFISTKTVHKKLGGFNVNIVVCEDCNYVKKARTQYGYKFRILKPRFYTSDRRAKAEGGFWFTLKYIRIHFYRMFTGKEIMKGDIEYNYGEF